MISTQVDRNGIIILPQPPTSESDVQNLQRVSSVHPPGLSKYWGAIMLYCFSSMLESMPQRSDFTNNNRNDKSDLGNSAAGTDERFNRANFFFNDLKASTSYVDTFMAIGTIFPFLQTDRNGNTPKIRYLCVAGNVRINLCHMSEF